MKILVNIRTKARQDKVEKTEGGYLVHVKEIPVENRANIALIKLLAGHFGVPRSRIVIVAGLKSKQKIVEIKDYQED